MTSNLILPTTNILQRVLKLKCGNRVGSGVVIFRDSNGYLVTAKHAIEYAPNATFYRRGGGWLPVRPRKIKLSENYDIAVLQLTIYEGHPGLQVPDYEIGISSAGIVLGQQVMIVGYPFGWELKASVDINYGRPLPLVKVGFLSNMPIKDEPLLIDANVNVGFSGGPIVFNSPSESDRNRLSICGIQSAKRVDEGIAFAVQIEKAIELIDTMQS